MVHDPAGKNNPRRPPARLLAAQAEALAAQHEALADDATTPEAHRFYSEQAAKHSLVEEAMNRLVAEATPGPDAAPAPERPRRSPQEIVAYFKERMIASGLLRPATPWEPEQDEEVKGD